MTPRSWLFIPADSEKKLGKADATGADALILDLEDAVAPDRKPGARKQALDFLMARTPGGRMCQLWVRVNPLDDSALEDLAAVMPGAPDGIVVPKIDGPEDIIRLATLLDAFEAAYGLRRGQTLILPVATETAAAALGMGAYSAEKLPRLIGVTWGAEDLSTAVHASSNRAEDGSLALVYRMARANVLLAARAQGVAPIETLYADFRDNEGLRGSSSAAAAEGFTGRIAIHPAQVSGINASFTPSAAEVAFAERVVAAFAASGEGTVGLDGRMLDIPHLRQAERVLERAHAVSDLEEET